MIPSFYFHTGADFYRACGRHFRTRTSYPFAAGRGTHSGRGIWRRTPVTVLCDVWDSDDENMFLMLKKSLEISLGRLMGTIEELLFEEYHRRNATWLYLCWICTRKS